VIGRDRTPRPESMLVIHPYAWPRRFVAPPRASMEPAAEIPRGNGMIFLPVAPPSSARDGSWRDRRADRLPSFRGSGLRLRDRAPNG